jgi:hypothetical protein
MIFKFFVGAVIATVFFIFIGFFAVISNVIKQGLSTLRNNEDTVMEDHE